MKLKILKFIIFIDTFLKKRELIFRNVESLLFLGFLSPCIFLSWTIHFDPFWPDPFLVHFWSIFDPFWPIFDPLDFITALRAHLLLNSTMVLDTFPLWISPQKYKWPKIYFRSCRFSLIQKLSNRLYFAMGQRDGLSSIFA